MMITSRIKTKAPCLLLLCLASAVTASQSPGFSPGDLAQAARALDSGAQHTDAVRRIAAQTEILRAVLANDLPNAQRRISRDELQVLTIALGAPTVTRDIMLSWLMRSGVTVAADGEISGIYSPLADAWLVLHWAQLGGSPRLIDAALVRGTSLRPAESQPDWLTSPAPFAAALLQTKLKRRTISQRCPLHAMRRACSPCLARCVMLNAQPCSSVRPPCWVPCRPGAALTAAGLRRWIG